MKITATKQTAPLKYRSYVSECNFNYCMHYNEDRRRCALRRCFYDRNFNNTAKKVSRRDIEDAMKWHG